MVLRRLGSKKDRRCVEQLIAAVRHLGREAMELLCPPTCPACRKHITHSRDVLCLDCWRQLQQNLQGQACPVCGHNTGPYALINNRCHRCQQRRPIVNQVVRVGDYSGVLRELILAFKFRRQSHLDCFLGSLLAARVMGDSHVRKADLLVPIPLHWRRRWLRTYDQSDLLARAAAHDLKKQGCPIPVNCDLVRVRHTEPQTSLAVSHRLLNLHGAFAVRPDAQYQGKHICLIDDVATTGTTLRVSANMLRKAGAARISAAVLAVAAND